MVRTFVAVELSDALRQGVGEWIGHLAAAGADVKWVEAHNLHFTLKFLGEVPTEQTAAICQAAAAATAEEAPFELELHGTGAFPSAARPRTVWVGAAGGKEAMIALHRRVDKAIKKLGYPREDRRFEPHLTIGRVRGGGPALAELAQRIRQHAGERLGIMPVRELVVFSSELSRSGPIYTPLGRGKLGG